MPPSFRLYRLESLGVPYQIEVERRSGVQILSDEALRAVLPPFTRTQRATIGRRYRFARVGRRRTLIVEDEAPIACPTVRAAQDALEGDLALHVAAECPSHIFIHAGVVAWRGRALVLPGRTLTGKSTLVAALLAAGATYYSDEYALIDGDGRVHAYPRRLSLRRPRGLPRRVRPRVVGRVPIPVGWVLGSRYEALHGLELTALSPGRTALLLVDNAVAARLDSARVLSAARKVAEHAHGFTLVRGDAKGAVKELLPLLEDEGMVVSASGCKGDTDGFQGVAVAGRSAGRRVSGRDARRRGARL